MFLTSSCEILGVQKAKAPVWPIQIVSPGVKAVSGTILQLHMKN